MNSNNIKKCAEKPTTKVDWSKFKICCTYCGKDLGATGLEFFIHRRHTYLVRGRPKYFCDDSCYEKYKAQFEIVYKNEKMYKMGDDEYVPYIGCHYYFKTAEDCYQRMQQRHIGYYP